MLVEGPCEVTLEEFVVVYGFCNDAAHKLEVAEVVRVTMGGRVYCVCNTITG